ncbi:MAG TPA: HAMP domain-containing sensor histidine kinase [Nocardioidaceae bacterium]|nr:HAMP domain-containing sensor histidine kinase [Nocardioidaceae bacterium]
MRSLRPGLRGRVSAAFAVGAFGVSVLLAVTTYAIASTYLLDQRYETVLRQAVFNAESVNDAVLTTQPALSDLLERLDASGGESSSPLVLLDGTWYERQFQPGHGRLPTAFVTAATHGEPVRQRFQTAQGLAVAIALPLEASGGTYVEVFSLRELDQTLTTLAATFTGTATMTTALGLLLGLWASRRSLRPLTSVTTAAAAIAEGDLGTRLGAQRDRDLAGLADAFNRTAARLQARVERDARFAANVSHELRSPLTTMVNAVEVISDRADKLDPESREVLDLLADDVHRFARMVDDLLEISRFDAGVIRVRRQPTDIASLVQVVADRTAGRAVTEVEADAEALVCWLDRRRLERVVENLVRNAQIHGGGVTRVAVSATTAGQDAGTVADTRVARIAVEDAGPGVPQGADEKIFERFSRGAPHRSGNPEGVGLGLALVFEHVRLHGGRVWAEGRTPHGARFVVEIPTEPR